MNAPSAAPDPALAQIGGELRDARGGRGERIDQIAAFLRLRVNHLEALEAGELHRLPGPAYAIGYLRSYAAYLGLDGDHYAARLKSELERRAPGPSLTRVPALERKRRTSAVTSLSLLLVAALYAGYFLLRTEPADEVATIAAVPSDIGRLAADALQPRPAAPEPVPSQPSPEPAVENQPVDRGGPLPIATPPATVMAAASPAPVATASTGIPPVAPVGAAPPSPAAPDPAQANAAPADRLLAELEAGGSLGQGGAVPTVGVVLVATETSWVQVKSGAGDFVRTRTLGAGERLILPTRNDLALWTGNAGGVQIIVDGANLGVVGGRGQVVRDLGLGSEQLKARLAAR